MNGFLSDSKQLKTSNFMRSHSASASRIEYESNCIVLYFVFISYLF